MAVASSRNGRAMAGGERRTEGVAGVANNLQLWLRKLRNGVSAVCVLKAVCVNGYLKYNGSIHQLINVWRSRIICQ